jgi:hypothetical protein
MSDIRGAVGVALTPSYCARLRSHERGVALEFGRVSKIEIQTRPNIQIRVAEYQKANFEAVFCFFCLSVLCVMVVLGVWILGARVPRRFFFEKFKNHVLKFKNSCKKFWM